MRDRALSYFTHTPASVYAVTIAFCSFPITVIERMADWFGDSRPKCKDATDACRGPWHSYKCAHDALDRICGRGGSAGILLPI